MVVKTVLTVLVSFQRQCEKFLSEYFVLDWMLVFTEIRDLIHFHVHSLHPPLPGGGGSGGGRVGPSTKFSKSGVGGLDRISIFIGGLLGIRGWLFSGEVAGN